MCILAKTREMKLNTPSFAKTTANIDSDVDKNKTFQNFYYNYITFPELVFHLQCELQPTWISYSVAFGMADIIPGYVTYRSKGAALTTKQTFAIITWTPLSHSCLQESDMVM